MGSIPVRVTNKKSPHLGGGFSCCRSRARDRGSNEMPCISLLGFAYPARRSGCLHTRRRARVYSRKARNSRTGQPPPRWGLFLLPIPRAGSGKQRNALHFVAWVRIPRPKIGVLAHQAQGAGIFAQSAKFPYGSHRLREARRGQPTDPKLIADGGLSWAPAPTVGGKAQNIRRRRNSRAPSGGVFLLPIPRGGGFFCILAALD